MEFDEFHSLFNNEIEPYLWSIRMWTAINALGIKPYKDGNQWCFLYGKDIQSGICGFGDTIEKAADAFYQELLTNINQKQ